jgi:1,4-dihydroxy-2-naphthoate octaprenyltransferase
LIGGGFGTAMAGYERGGVVWLDYALAQLTVTAFHLMTHYANDYFDRHADARSVPTPYSGGSGVLVEGSLAPAVALRAALVAAAAGVGGIVLLVAIARRPEAALLGCAIGVLAWSYSAPPLRLLARGLGELDTALVVAILVPLCAFTAQGATVSPRAVASTLPAAAAMFAMMLAVEYPDLAADAAGGKANLVVRLGAGAARPLGVAFVAAVYGALALALAAGAPPAFLLCEAISLPLGLGLALAFARRIGATAVGDENLAARGVAFFFIVMLCGLLAFAAAPGARGAASATIRTEPVVLGT